MDNTKAFKAAQRRYDNMTDDKPFKWCFWHKTETEWCSECRDHYCPKCRCSCEHSEDNLGEG